jgi:hypothetical protein
MLRKQGMRSNPWSWWCGEGCVRNGRPEASHTGTRLARTRKVGARIRPRTCADRPPPTPPQSHYVERLAAFYVYGGNRALHHLYLLVLPFIGGGGAWQRRPPSARPTRAPSDASMLFKG